MVHYLIHISLTWEVSNLKTRSPSASQDFCWDIKADKEVSNDFNGSANIWICLARTLFAIPFNSSLKTEYEESSGTKRIFHPECITESIACKYKN